MPHRRNETMSIVSKKAKIEKWLEKRRIDKVLKCLDKHSDDKNSLRLLAHCIDKKRASGTTDKNTNTLLLEGSKDGNMAMVILALMDGADINTFDRWGSALLKAMFNANRRIAEILIHLGAGVDAKDPSGETILMDAASGSLPHMVELLIKKRVNPFARNKYTKSAKDIAKEREKKDPNEITSYIVTLLENYEIYVIRELERARISRAVSASAGQPDKEVVRLPTPTPEAAPAAAGPAPSDDGTTGELPADLKDNYQLLEEEFYNL